MYQLGEHKPSVAGDFYIAPGAQVIGQVEIGLDVSIWFNAVVRADNDLIQIGDGSNIQDGAVVHVDPGHPVSIGKRVTVGHKAMLHGCSVGDGSLIGMNAVVLNDAVIGKRCLIGANALVKEGMHVPDNSLVLGSPGRIVKQLDEAAFKTMDAGAQSYIDKISLYKTHLVSMTT